MSLDALQRQKLKKIIKELEGYSGRHTELVTVYVPTGYDLTSVINHLLQEQGTAENIKSTSTRKNVIDALTRMIQHLRVVGRTPPNGLAAFSGNVAEREGQSDVRVWSIEPPVPLKVRIYRCDKQFVLEPLLDMCDIKEIYGLVVMDRREGDIALLKGKSIIPVSSAKSNVPGKTRAGGQSAHRFERLREGAAKEFFKKIADMMKDAFFTNAELKGVLVGGPGTTKYEWIDGGYITTELKNKIIAIKDLSYTGDFGLQELVEKCQDVLANEDIAKEKKIMGQFFTLLATDSAMVTYGKDDVMEKINMGAVDKALISEDVEDSVIEQFEEAAAKVGSEIVLISTETREGVQLRDMGKFAAILRYKLYS